ncbi:MAG: alkaline phosphatase family protein, partial [Chloroflexi bacterium]|nr:alkaline phosphatase family protein [Chloroflexota bacterium]
AVDGISHLYGTTAEHAINEIRRQLVDLRETLLTDGVGDGRTLFMLAADHGHTPVPDYLDLSQHPLLTEALRCDLGGEGRFAYLYLRNDYRDAIVDYLSTHFSEQVIALNPAEALSAGLFGTEAPYRESAPRLGDLALIARQKLHIGHKPLKSTAVLSRHGGLSDREMLVPLLMRVL